MVASVQDLILAAQSRGAAQNRSPILDLISTAIQGFGQTYDPFKAQLLKRQEEIRAKEEAEKKEREKTAELTRKTIREKGKHFETISVGPKGVTSTFQERQQPGEILYVDKVTGREIRREVDPGSKGVKVVKIGGKVEDPVNAMDILQKTHKDALRTGFFTDTYFETFNALADTANIPPEQRPTQENPIPPGLLETIYGFKPEIPGVGEEGVFKSLDEANRAIESDPTRYPLGSIVTVEENGVKKQYKVE